MALREGSRKSCCFTLVKLLSMVLPRLGATGSPPSSVNPFIPTIEPKPGQIKGRRLKHIFDEEGPEAFAKAVRANEGLLITDTTWRDAHQSLLATRLRTYDMRVIAPATRVALANAYSLECWGGATFDVSLRFLRECPWERLATLRSCPHSSRCSERCQGTPATWHIVFEFCQRQIPVWISFVF
jgi:pyruvate carboxylase